MATGEAQACWPARLWDWAGEKGTGPSPGREEWGVFCPLWLARFSLSSCWLPSAGREMCGRLARSLRWVVVVGAGDVAAGALQLGRGNRERMVMVVTNIPVCARDGIGFKTIRANFAASATA